MLPIFRRREDPGRRFQRSCPHLSEAERHPIHSRRSCRSLVDRRCPSSASGSSCLPRSGPIGQESPRRESSSRILSQRLVCRISCQPYRSRSKKFFTVDGRELLNSLKERLKSRYFNNCQEELTKTRFASLRTREPQERFRAPNWEKNSLAKGITCSRRHSTVGGSSFPYSPASEAKSVQSRSNGQHVAHHQPVGLFQRFRRCGVELRRAERLLPTSLYPGSSEPHFAPGSRISQAHH